MPPSNRKPAVVTIATRALFSGGAIAAAVWPKSNDTVVAFCRMIASALMTGPYIGGRACDAKRMPAVLGADDGRDHGLEFGLGFGEFSKGVAVGDNASAGKKASLATVDFGASDSNRKGAVSVGV